MRRLAVLLALVALAGCSVAGCSVPGDPPVFEGRAVDLPAPADAFALYAFVADSAGTGDDRTPTASGRLVPVAEPNSVAWDIGFRGTGVFLNGGSSGPGAGVGVVVEQSFEAVTDALREDVFYRRDGESPCPTGPPRAVCAAPGTGWFDLMALPGGGQAVVPRIGTTLLLRLGDGQGYAKVAFESYYRGAPGPGAITAASEPGYVTVRFAVDPDGGSFVDEE